MKHALVNITLAIGIICILGGCSEIILAKMAILASGVAQAKQVAEGAVQVAQAAENVGVPYAGEAAGGLGILVVLLSMFQRHLQNRTEADLKTAHARVSSMKAEVRELANEVTGLKVTNVPQPYASPPSQPGNTP